MSAAPARGGKGAGSGPPPPPPRGKGGAPPAITPAAPAHGGKGAKPGPPLPPSQPRGKGPAASGKGGARRPYAAPPPDLVAPESAAVLQHLAGLPSAEGTVWEGLDPWGRAESDAGLLEGAAIDYDAVRLLWGPLPAPPTAPALRNAARRSALPSKLAMNAEIAVKATGLTPPLVLRALTEDMDAITPQQAAVLSGELVPMAQEAAAYLHAAVSRSGEESLNTAEAVIWAMHSVPMGITRARLVAQRHTLEQEVADLEGRAEAAEALVAALKACPALRTLMQTILAVRNVLMQEGNPGYELKSLDRLPNERLNRGAPTTFDATGRPVPVSLDWIRAQTPSVLTLVSRMLQSTHERRCRLRFMRMMAVGRLMSSDDLRKLTWSYLDDLQASPWDVLQTLEQCTDGCCCREAMEDMSRQQMHLRQLLVHDLRHLAPLLPVTGALAEQVEALRGGVSEGLARCEGSADRVAAAATALCRLSGNRRAESGAVAARLDAAGEALLSLRALGRRLGQEAAADRSRREKEAQERLQSMGSTGSCRAWTPVQTDAFLLYQTTDPDLIRQLRGLGARAAPRDPGPPPAAPGPRPDAAEGQEEEARPNRYVDLVHGGAEGSYVRDPGTGRWGRRLDGQDGTTSAVLNLGTSWTPA